MSFRRRALFLAGLFVAVSCSDAGNPLDPDGPETPEPGSEEMALQALSCEVDAPSGSMECTPLSPSAGGAAGAINIGGGSSSVNGTFVKLTSSNSVWTPTLHTFDVTIKNNMVGQIMGTQDGTTAHPYGMKVFFFDPANPTIPQPVVVEKADPAQSATISVNGDGSQKFAGAGTTLRPYFQYAPQVLLPGQTSGAETWSFAMFNVKKYKFVAYVSTEVRHPKGWLNIIPDSPVMQVGTSETLTAQVRNAFGNRISEVLNWSTSNPAVVSITSTADSTAVIKAEAEGNAWIKAVTNHPNAADQAARRDSVLVTVDNAPAVPMDSIDVPARALIRLSSTRLRQGLAVGDSVIANQADTTAHGIATVDADRGFTYVSRGSFTGTDTVQVAVTDGRWTVNRTMLVKVASTNYWFVQPGGAGDGSNAYPLGTLQAAVDSAGAGDTILVLRNGSTDLTGAATLKSNQAVIGHGVLADSVFLRVTGLNEPGRVDSIFQGQGLGSPLANTGAAVITLASDAASNNIIRGVNITATNAAPISGIGFGTLTLSRVTAQSTGGPALSLLGGNVAAVFTGLHSTGSTGAGLSLTNVNGSILAIASSIATSTGTAFSVSGGDVDVNFPGNISQTTANPLLSVSGHTGDLVFGGTLTANAGTGLQFSNADGTYNLGTLSFGGGDAAVDVISGSAGTFTFAAASNINDPSGNVFRIEGSAPTFTYPGSFSKTNAGVGVLIQNNTGGSATFSGASKVLSTGASHAVSIVTDETNVSFTGGNLQINTSGGGRGFSVQDGDTIAVTGAGNTILTSGAQAVFITNAHTGTSGISFQSVTGTGAANAVVLSGVAGAGFQITGTGSAGSGGTLSATNTAVSISSADSSRFRRVLVNAPAAFSATSFGGLRVDSSTVTATAGKALGLATGRLYVSDVAVSSTGGAALDANAVTLNGILSSLSGTTATGNLVLLTNALGSLTASTGTLTVNAGGGAAIVVTGLTGVGLTYSGSVTQNANAALLDVNGGHTGTLTFNTGTLAAPHGSGLQFSNADGTYSFGGTTNLSNSTVGADAGIDVTNGSGGTFTFPSTTTVTNPANEVIRIANSGPAFTYDGTIQKTNGSTGITVTGSTGTITFNSISGTVRTITSGTTNPAVNLTSNTGATIHFGGGNLAISSDDGNAFNATGGGTVTVQGLTNTLSSTGGIALNVNATTIGASGLTFRSINANGGSNGIALNNVGTGALNVVGNGGVCTIATPTCSGGTIQNTSGDGVSLNTVQRVRLDLVRVLNSAGHGVSGTSASGLTIANSLIQGAGDADNEAGIFFATLNASNLTGTDSIISSVVHAPSDVGVYIHNYGGTLNLVVQGSTFSGTDKATAGVVTGDDLFRLISDRAASSATVTAKFTGNTFDQSESDGLAALAQSSTGSGGGTLNVTVDGNTFTGDNGGASCATGCNDNGIVAWGTQASVVRFTIQNNNVVNQRNEAIGVRADNTASVQGTIQNNTVGTATAQSGSFTAQGIFLNSDDNADLVVRVHNNLVRSTFWQGIWANSADGTGGTPKMDVTITSNTTPTPHDNGGTYLPSIDVQGTTNANVCAKVESNTAAAGRAGAGSVDMLQFNTALFRIEGLPSPTNDASSYLAGKNPASTAPVYAVAAGSGSTFTNATCRTPAATPSL